MQRSEWRVQGLQSGDQGGYDRAHLRPAPKMTASELQIVRAISVLILLLACAFLRRLMKWLAKR
jgi:hypothetical protein